MSYDGSFESGYVKPEINLNIKGDDRMADLDKTLGQLQGLLQGGGNSGGMDAATMMALMNDNGGLGGNNNIIILLFFLMMFNGNGFGMNNGGAGMNAAANTSAIEGQLEAAINRAAANESSFSMIKDAVMGNGADIRQLANNLNCDFNAVNGAISDLKFAFSQVAGDLNCGLDKVIGAVGNNGQQIINAVIQGNGDIKSAIQSCCCETTRTMERGFSQLALQQQELSSASLLRDQTNNSALQLSLANLNTTIQQEGCETRRAIADTAREQELSRLNRELDSANRHAQTQYLIKELG